MSFIHIPKTQMQQMFRTSRTDQSAEVLAGITIPNTAEGVTYISHNGGAGWMTHNSFISQIVSPQSASGLKLYKGVMPTVSEIDAFQYINTTPYGSNNSNDFWTSYIRSADQLVKLNINGSGSGINAAGELVVNLTAGNATQTGTASWFCFRTMPISDQGSFGVNQAYTIFGTVGAVGSGADLELLTTTVTSGLSVRIGTFKIPFPTSITW